MKDYYKTLEINFGADILTVKKAYRHLALKYHPDKNHSHDATQKFIEITEAYEVLRNPLKKQEYDSIYSAYFRTQSQYPKAENTYENKQKEWSDYGKEKANEYSSIPFDEFARRLLKEISVGVSFVPNLISMLFTAAMGIVFLTLIPTTNGYGAGLPIFLILFSIGAFYLTYRLYLVAEADYKEARKRKL